MTIMKNTRLPKGVRKSLTGALVVLALGGASSVQATSDNPLPIVGPQAPPPQGLLTVYSERYVMVDADAPEFYRRPVELYAGEESEYARQMFAASLRAALTLDEVRDLVRPLGFEPDSVTQTSDRHWTWSAVKQ